MKYSLPPAQQKGKELEVIFDDFKDGYISLLDEASLPPTALRETLNVELTQRNKLRPRPGSKYYGATLTGPISGAGEFVDSATDIRYLWVIDNGDFKYSTDGGAWTTVAGATFTTTVWTVGEQDRSRLFLTNGTDNLAYLDITDLSLNVYNTMATPTGLNVAKTGLATTTFTYYYRITAINNVGESAATVSAVAGSTIVVSLERDDWDSSNYVTLTWNAVAGAQAYGIYIGTSEGGEVFLTTINGTTFKDTGVTSPNDYIAAPIDNTTTGPKLKTLTASGNRIWGVANDGAVWWGGSGNNSGKFSPFFDGGYIYIQKGSREKPQTVVHFRDGKGNPLPTVLTSTPDGSGGAWHINLTTAEIGTTTVTIPETYKSDASIGTNSPRGVVAAQNNQYYPSSVGWQVLGARPNLLNVLAVRDISRNIEKDIINLIQDALDGVTGIYWQGKILWSVPYGSSTNNEVWVLDLERNAWILRWDIGVKHFFTYTDSDGTTHLMAVPTSGTKLIEFSKNIYTFDCGVAFPTKITSGLNHWDKTRLSWAKPKYAYVELSRPKGQVSFAVSGTEKSKSFSTLGSITIADSTSNAGFSTYMFSQVPFSDMSQVPDYFAEASVKKRIKINKRLNNYSWQLSSDMGDVDYTLAQVTVKGGYPVKTSDPSSWKS